MSNVHTQKNESCIDTSEYRIWPAQYFRTSQENQEDWPSRNQDQGSCSEESFEDSEDEEFRKRMEAEEKQADSDFDIDFNLSDEEDFCDKTEPENSHNVWCRSWGCHKRGWDHLQSVVICVSKLSVIYVFIVIKCYVNGLLSLYSVVMFSSDMS